MYVKLSFQELTQTGCMSLNLFYKLAEKPTIIDTLPPGAEANKQARIPDEPALNDMFGAFNACHYDYYVDCGDADKETIEKVLAALSAACGGKLPAVQADEQYLSDGQNLIVNGLIFSLDALKRDKSIDSQSLQQMVAKEIKMQMIKHEKESMKKFFSMMMFGNEKPSTQNEEELTKMLAAMSEEPTSDSSQKMGI